MRAGIEQLAREARPVDACAELELWRGRLHVELALLAALDAQLRLIDAKLDGLADEGTALLQTVKGVGPRVAEAVVAHLDDPARFRSAKAVAGYAGLVPRQFESGTVCRGNAALRDQTEYQPRRG